MGLTGDYGFIERFWIEGIEVIPDRGWVVATLYDGDYWLRDGFALCLVRSQLHGRPDVQDGFVRAWTDEPYDELKNRNVLFLGRPRAYLSSRFTRLAHALSTAARARFIDNSTGSPGNTIAYGGGRHLFARNDLDVPPEHHRRSDRDYAVFQMATLRVGGEDRRLVSLAGTSSFGTLGLAMLLADAACRRRLVEQLRSLLPWKPELRPHEYFEFCVCIQVPADRLQHFLNHQEFDFQVEVVAMGGELRVLGGAVEVILTPKTLGEGGVVRVKGSRPVDLTAQRFRLLRFVVDEPEVTTTDDLCRKLGFSLDDRGHKRLAKLVHDVNNVLERIPTLGIRPLQARKQGESKRRYLLAGVRGIVQP